MSSRAAIYARVSKKDDDATTTAAGQTEEAISVKRQVRGAREFITSMGWTCHDHHVYQDSGVSGALFLTRPEFQRMLLDAEAGAFDILVIFDLDRFGRHAKKTMQALDELAECGVEVWDYSTRQPIDLDSFEGELVTYVKTRSAQAYRDQNRKHNKAHSRSQAEQGYVTGCRVFGYDNIGIKGHKRRVPNAEAAIVQEIFERYARGEGYRSIAWTLNARGVASPRAQRGRPRGWEAGTIRAILGRPLYRGEIVYGRSKKVYGKELGRRATREKGQVRVPESEWIRVDDESVRIVDRPLAEAVDARRVDRESRYLRSAKGQLIGRPPEGAKYLLSGILKCPCGGSFEALKGGNWSHHGQSVYVCGARRRKGPKVCPHNHAFPIEDTDDRILSVIEGDVLSPDFIETVLNSAFSQTYDRASEEATRQRLQQEIGNLTKAVAAGGDIPSLVELLQKRQTELRRVEARLRPSESPDREQLRLALEQRVADWRKILRANRKQARQVLLQLIGPIEVFADEPIPHWMTQPRPAGLLTGLYRLVQEPDGRVHAVAPDASPDGVVQALASPTGFEPVF